VTIHEEWRIPKRRRIFAWAFVLLYVGLGVAGCIGGAIHHNPWLVAVAVAAFGGLALLFYRMVLYPKVTATDYGLTVKNPIRTYEIAWSEVVQMSPGIYGLFIWRTNGRRIMATAVEGKDGRFMRGAEPRPDQIVDEMNRLAEVASGVPHSFRKRPPGPPRLFETR
jgi:hypothetical protein